MPKTKTHKTEAVMRLIMGGADSAVNPMIDEEFKEEVITPRLSPEERAEKNAEIEKFRKNSVDIDVAAELVSELLPKAMRRFNCCNCPLCFADAMADALDTVPKLKVRLRADNDIKKADALKKKSRRDILLIIIRLVIVRRGLPKCDEA
ncbi:MAG: hypothetical protein FWG90_04090 [Oscillospiraceae bacterium]|nr:hypothetical protein [Oscillospiraceae bacterium]